MDRRSPYIASLEWYWDLKPYRFYYEMRRALIKLGPAFVYEKCSHWLWQMAQSGGTRYYQISNLIEWHSAIISLSKLVRRFDAKYGIMLESVADLLHLGMETSAIDDVKAKLSY